MIIYEPFWKTIKSKNVSTYTLIQKHKVSSSTLTRLRHNKPLSTVTINDLCRILECNINDIAKYVTSDDDQKL